MILIIIISALVIALAGITLNIVRLVNLNSADSYDYVSVGIALLVSAVGFVVFLTVLLNSHFTVTDEQLILNWGFLKNRLDIKSITRITLEQTKMRLAIYYNTDDFFTINAKTVDSIELVEELRRKNNKIVFEISSIEKDDDEKKRS